MNVRGLIAALGVVGAGLCGACGVSTAQGGAPTEARAAPPLLAPAEHSGGVAGSSVGDFRGPVIRSAEIGGTVGSDTPISLAFDSSGASTLLVRHGGAPDRDYTLQRRSAAGEVTWSLAWYAPVSVPEWAVAGLGTDGEVFLYATDGALTFVRKLDGAGRFAWDTTLAVADPPRQERIAALRPTSDGGALVLMEHFADPWSVWRVLRLDPSGATTSSVELGEAIHVTIEGTGEAVALDTLGLRKLAADGTERWRIEHAEGVRGVVAPSADGGVFVLLWPGAHGSFRLVSVSAEGAIRWVRPGGELLDALQANDPGSPDAIDIHASGRFRISTRYWPADLPVESVLAVADAQGRLEWAWTYPYPDLFSEYPISMTHGALAFDPSGRLWVAGSFREMDFGGQHLVPQGPNDAFLLQLE
jgi:hypothetical protein